MSSREQILARLRSREKPFPQVTPSAAYQPMTPLAGDGPSLLARFVNEAQALNAVVHQPSGEAQAIREILDILGSDETVLAWDWSSIPLPGLPAALEAARIAVAAPRDSQVRVGNQRSQRCPGCHRVFGLMQRKGPVPGHVFAAPCAYRCNHPTSNCAQPGRVDSGAAGSRIAGFSADQQYRHCLGPQPYRRYRHGTDPGHAWPGRNAYNHPVMRRIQQVLLIGVGLCVILILHGAWNTPGARGLTLDNIARAAPALVILGVYALIAILAPEA